jgi:DNA-directed RNA polymerase subunit RPC12/RpoP
MYSINQGPYQDLLDPYDIDTNDMEDGNYNIDIQAEDTSENINTGSFNFIVDSTPPTISLNSPTEGSFIGSSPEIDLSISDENLNEVFYSINSGRELTLFEPYVVDGSNWSEGLNILTIFATDLAGNSNEKSYTFTKDGILPKITLKSPDNGSILNEFSSLDFDVSDDNLDSVMYSINQGSYQTLEDPYDLNTLEWTDGEHKITIKAEDTVRNINEKWFIFRKDTMPPSIESSSISDNDVNIEVNSQIVIEFSEPMDTESVESAISISPFTEYSSSWSNDNTTLTITCNDLMEYETLYQVTISTKAKDIANRGMEDTFEVEFTTQADPKESEEGDFPVLYLILTLLAVGLIAVLILVMTMSKKKKTAVSGVDSELLGGVGQVSQTIQFNCYYCNNLLQVNDTGVTQNVSCPYCSSPLVVQSRTTPAQVPQSQLLMEPQLEKQFHPQQSMQQIACPMCLHRFSVVKTGSPIRVQCPNCKTTGTMG